MRSAIQQQVGLRRAAADRSLAEASGLATFAVLTGDFAAAQSYLDTFEGLLASSIEESDHLDSTTMRSALAIEEGRAAAGDKVLLVGGAAGFSAAVIPLIL